MLPTSFMSVRCVLTQGPNICRFPAVSPAILVLEQYFRRHEGEGSHSMILQDVRLPELCIVKARQQYFSIQVSDVLRPHIPVAHLHAAAQNSNYSNTGCLGCRRPFLSKSGIACQSRLVHDKGTLGSGVTSTSFTTFTGHSNGTPPRVDA